MGYDLYSRKNKAYFRNNIWWWHDLWDFVCMSCEEFLNENDVIGGHSNSGHYISKVKAQKIYERLSELLKSGKVAQVEDLVKKHNEGLRTPCIECEGTGYQPPAELKDRPCTKCNGTGKIVNNPFAEKAFTEENVKEFANFCEESKGFVIS